LSLFSALEGSTLPSPPAPCRSSADSTELDSAGTRPERVGDLLGSANGADGVEDGSELVVRPGWYGTFPSRQGQGRTTPCRRPQRPGRSSLRQRRSPPQGGATRVRAGHAVGGQPRLLPQRDVSSLLRLGTPP
jgi:hypothetical protein